MLMRCAITSPVKELTADVYTVAGIDVADPFAKNDDFPGNDIRRRQRIPANRDSAIR